MNKRIKTKLVLKQKAKIVLSKILLTIIIFLIGMILVKNNPEKKLLAQVNIYEKSLPFQNIKLLYEKYFGNILSVDKALKKTEAVFHEQLTYEGLEPYQNGVQLKVSSNYMVPVIESGIIVFIGEKEGLGNTVIIEQIDGVDTYYADISLNNKNLYDYVEKGELLGEVNNKLYLAFQKKGEYLDYKNYF